MSTNDDLPPLPRPFMELQRELVPVVYEAWEQQMQAYAREAVAACVARLEARAAELSGETMSTNATVGSWYESQVEADYMMRAADLLRTMLSAPPLPKEQT